MGMKCGQCNNLFRITHQILIDNSIAGSKESKDMRDEMPLLWLKFLPVVKIFGQIHLLGSPERGFCLLVHLPDVVVLDGEHYKPARVFFQ